MKKDTQTKIKMDFTRRKIMKLCFFEIISVLIVYTCIYACIVGFIRQFIIEVIHVFFLQFSKVIHFDIFVFLRMSFVLLKRIRYAKNY